MKRILANPWSSNLFLAGFSLLLLGAYALADLDDDPFFERTVLVWVTLVLAYLLIFGAWKLLRYTFTYPISARPTGNIRRRRTNIMRTPWVLALCFLAYLLAGLAPNDEDLPSSPHEVFATLGLFVALAFIYGLWTVRVTLKRFPASTPSSAAR